MLRLRNQFNPSGQNSGKVVRPKVSLFIKNVNILVYQLLCLLIRYYVIHRDGRSSDFGGSVKAT